MSGDVGKWKLLGARSHFDAAESHMKWDDLTDLGRQHVMKAFDDQLRAFLAAAEADGVVFVRVPEQMDWRRAEGAAQGFKVKGWNDALAAVLAGKVTV